MAASDGEILEGNFPNKQMKLLIAWMAIHEDELSDGYFKIEPLRQNRRYCVMLRPTAIYVEAICEYQILVEFDNGEKRGLMLSHI